ncbi:Polyol transporter 5 [Striga hermonthica]|uniref:Polyol transporter 5 n=1 Tax=Striga hermonthica TaxID=68872 RepID=A0A9N7MIT2_STRHE|nr:Polyol transporter 5 [Striga hermonthica]
MAGEKNFVSTDQSQLPTIPAFDPPKKPKRNKYALACSFLASMTSILLGYDIGVMSGAIIYIQKSIHMTDVQKEVIMGILNLYSLIGSAAAGRTSDWIGRRYTIIFAGAIFFAGALLMGFATNYAFLMVGRFVAGIGVGYALMIAPVYTAEVAPASSRGFLTSFPEVFINFGILLGYVSNFAFSKLPTHLGWRFMLGIGAVPSVLIAASVLAMPESPRWLVLQGRLGDARRVLDKTSDSLEESRLRLADIKEAAGIPAACTDDVVPIPNCDNHGGGVWRDLLIRPTPAVRHILLCGIGIHFFQQASGIDTVVLYSPEIFKRAGVTQDRDQLLATMAVGFVKTIFILVATFLLDKIGRRPLLLSSVRQHVKIEKSPSSVLSFILPSASLDWIRTKSRGNEVNNEPKFSDSSSFKWKSKSFSWKNKPLEKECHLETTEPGSGTSSSSGSDVFEDAVAPHSFEKPLPSFLKDSLFISQDLFEFFEASLPNIVKGCRWVLMYSTVRDGISLHTLVRKSTCLNGPCLLITGDKQGAVFGGLLDCPLKPTSKRRYQGTNQSFVFTTLYGEPRLFRPTGTNRYFYLCLNELIALGGGANFALSLSEDLLSGTSGPCETFGNLCLAHNHEFELKNVELWGFTHASQYLQ